MIERTPSKSARGAVATGAAATGVASLAAVAMGALAIGAVAVGALAIGRLTVGRARFRRVEIGELAVGRVDVGEADRPATVRRVRASAGKGDALARFLRQAMSRRQPGTLRAYRSAADPDLFLLQSAGQSPDIDRLLGEAAARSLAAAADAAEAVVFQAIPPAGDRGPRRRRASPDRR